MKINALAAVLLVALIPLRIRGQENPQPQAEEKKLQPILAKCETARNQFVKGQNIQINCTLVFLEGIKLSLEDLRDPGNKNFTIAEFSTTEPTPVPNQKDYNFIETTQILKPDKNLGYGKQSLKLKIGYTYQLHEWQAEKEGPKKKLVTKLINKTKAMPDIVIEKVPLTVEIDLGEGFQDVINIGEHIHVAYRLFYEDESVMLLNRTLSPVDLDKKFKIRDAANFDDPNLKPFVVINKDQAGKIDEKDHGDYKELVCSYRLALYEVDLKKMFKIPSLAIYYLSAGTSAPTKIITQPLDIRTNSVLNRDSDFRPLKNILGPDIEKLKYFGTWPTHLAYGLAGLASILICWKIIELLVRLIKKIYRAGLYESILLLRKSFVGKINGLTSVAEWRAERAFVALEKDPSQENLKKFIIRLRLYIAATIGIKEGMALSLTTAEFGKKINADALENAEYLLDEIISREDLERLNHEFSKLSLQNKELGTWS